MNISLSQLANIHAISDIIYPDKISFASGENAVLRTQEVWPISDATAPEPALLALPEPDEGTRTSYRMRRLSSDADRRS